MKKLFLIICLFYSLSGNVFGQTELPKPTAEEEREAKDLAVTFFNRFRETQDVKPLIKEYFIKDFSRRLKFCETTNECRGFARDFWAGPESDKKDFALTVPETDYLRSYTYAINYLFLYFCSIQHLNENYPQEMNENNTENAAKIIKKELELLLKENPQLNKFNFFDNSDENIYDPKTLGELRRLLNDEEKFLAALRTVESKLRTNFQKENPDANISFLSKDFRVDIDENSRSFFEYPIGTRIVEVWCENHSLLFKMDLIDEDGKLKIVAIYPPMD